MTWIEATCPECGPVECTAKIFELAVSERPEASWYAFTCPSCNQRVQKHAEERVVELLIAEGVTPTTWTVPAEADEQHEGPPLTLDDLLDLHLVLEEPDWFERLARTVHV